MPTLMAKFLLYSCICCTYRCVYTCTVHTDCDCTSVFPLCLIGASHPSRGHHHTPHTTHHTHKAKCWARVPRLKKKMYTMFEYMIIPCFYVCFHHVWRHVYTMLENMITKWRKRLTTYFGEFLRRVYIMYEDIVFKEWLH